ncbi:MAG: glycosyltransferase [Drouetiella hepatica Uher 2000/2452]|jgi:glycosyltransferase involved in cell wall biosynthesis|uniref:Glycosyltransferase n=1 Tax=Drouetiella hepatica Uher 2000/2452 TaxID=904376 RepID=A0A951UPQ5_9CYAN|nr:glycosyltransferase [Drouetiella hepatica Uher 2000/2452]
MSVPTLSVLMPVHNAERFVAEAVESILNQTFDDFEFLIVDDGSSDRSLAILQRYAAQDARIQLISREKTGYVAALNEMVKLARGEFLARMDADDIAMRDRFCLQVARLRQDPDLVCLGGTHGMIDEKGRWLTCLAMPEQNEEIQKLALAGHTPINHPCAMMRRSAVLQVGAYDATLAPCEDLDLWLRLGEIGKLANLKEMVLKYRLHANSVSEKQGALQRQKAREVCSQAWRRRGIKGTFEATESWRPGCDRPSRYKFMLRYGWWAFNSGQRQTAFLYGCKAIQALPWQGEGWRLLVSAAIKPTEAKLTEAKLTKTELIAAGDRSDDGHPCNRK